MHRGWVLLGVLGIGAGAALSAVLGTSRAQATVPAAAAGREVLQVAGITEYKSMCNASAAVSVGKGRFVVADDEDQILRLFRIGQAGPPLSQDPIPPELLDLEAEHLEVDIEGAAEIGDRVFWIGSHSASHDCKPRPNRRRLFATKLRVGNDGQLKVVPVGKAYKKLIHDLDDDDRYKKFHLPEAAKLQPKADGALSIEGLASTPRGDLLIGFRNPIIDGKALVARLKNPEEVIDQKSGEFGKPILLDLGGRGIRSIERLGSEYYIVAGRHDERKDSKLYRWTGEPDSAPELVSGVDFTGVNPEALFFDAAGIYILSDDGKRPIGAMACEDLGMGQRLFRGFRINP